MAGAFGGASEVMNKMTGQEQKEIYQHAVDEYNRKSSRANAAFTRRQGLLQERNQRATTRATTRANYLAADRLTHEKDMSVLEYNRNVWEQQNALDLSEQERERANQDYYAKVEETYNSHWGDMAQNTITGDPISGRAQNMRQIGLPYANMGSVTAQTQVNLATLEKQGEASLGDLTVLKQLQPDLYALTQNSIGEDGQIDQSLLRRNQTVLQEKYPWMQL